MFSESATMFWCGQSWIPKKQGLKCINDWKISEQASKSQNCLLDYSSE